MNRNLWQGPRISFLGALALLGVIAASFPMAHPRAAQGAWEERPEWRKHFDAEGVEGTFLLYDLRRDARLGYNLQRAKERYLPASTFKILNSLIALELGVARDAEYVIPWDGIDRGIPEWNRDLSMREAIRLSAVWYYQELARRTGAERMRQYVERAGYGNSDIGGGIDRFWLDGNLRISAIEQIGFLTRLYKNEVPFSRRSIDIVKDILVVEKTPAYTLRAKTGWARPLTAAASGFAADRSDGNVDSKRQVNLQLGWWVGYVEREGAACFFALNIDIRQDREAQARMSVTRAILREMGIIN
jgi:beta-lactamase class D